MSRECQNEGGQKILEWEPPEISRKEREKTYFKHAMVDRDLRAKNGR